MCKKHRTGSLHHCKTLQSQRVCFPQLTHPLAHINIAQALSSPLSHISGVAKCHDSPLFDAKCRRTGIMTTVNDFFFALGS